ncbi:MAG TPA: hypothetical protein VMM37_00750, partial [Bacteroidota bacterium]|nr:hypothetical protein [Bacteroidota bacterium]
MNHQVILRKNEERRILAGHQWVFSNEIAGITGTPSAGDVVEILKHDRSFIGLGFYHPHSLIAVRFLTPNREDIRPGFFENRIN